MSRSAQRFAIYCLSDAMHAKHGTISKKHTTIMQVPSTQARQMQPRKSSGNVDAIR
jgi:hypothetical protein